MGVSSYVYIGPAYSIRKEEWKHTAKLYVNTCPKDGCSNHPFEELEGRYCAKCGSLLRSTPRVKAVPLAMEIQYKLLTNSERYYVLDTTEVDGEAYIHIIYSWSARIEDDSLPGKCVDMDDFAT